MQSLDAAPSIVGEKLGRWTVSRLLARGGMAEIYLGVQPAIGAEVAIKVLAASHAGDRDLIERFFAEARAVNRIRNERIVSILDLALLGDGRPYVIMERLRGASLGRVMAGGPLPPAATVALAVEVLDALAAAHAAGVIHRDLKPDNIFVTPAGHAKVLDFGVAKLLAPELRNGLPSTATGIVLGTPRYMSPEQSAGGEVGPASDLYSLGVVLREALDPGEGAPLAPALDAVIARALAKSPADRFPSAAEMGRALLALQLPPGPPLEVPVEEIDRPAADPPIPFEQSTARRRPAEHQVGRFVVRELLGEGGVGQVFRAWDPQLRRDVALKLLRVSDPSLARRLVSEAQAHARIEHPRVCRIYEVDEADGRPYIAMQLIEGEPLSSAARSLDRPGRLRVVRDIAEALQAVHDLGLVHRDVKPSNIMIGDDGTAYLMDFGLAREIGAAGLTATGAVLGTPEYMSPEQARGDTRALDHRADIYALGATLYEMVVGRPPFEAETTALLVYRVIHEEPVAPRTLDPGISRDLQTVVLRCLEKDPRRRFASAKELAEDLARVLAGEPIHARPPTLRERMVKLVRRHRLASIAASLTLLFALGLTGLALEARRRSIKAAGEAQHFGREAAQIESLMHDAMLLPMHDLRPEKARARERIAALEAQLPAVDRAARAAGHHAIGRAWLALGDVARGERELETAWQSGLHEAEVAYALSRALVEEYHGAMIEAGRATGEQQRKLQAEAAARFRDPMVRYARLAQSAPDEAPGYLEGLVAYAEDRFDDALALAEKARAARPMSAEAAELAGDVLLERGLRKARRGEPSALDDLQRAGEAFRTGQSIARSDGRLYTRECVRVANVMSVLLATGKPLEAMLAEAHAACDKARTVDAESPAAYTNEMDAIRIDADWLTNHGGDPRKLVDDGLALGAKALSLDGQNLDALSDIAILDMTRSDFERARGIDPTHSFDDAAAATEKMIALYPRRVEGWQELGDVLGSRGFWVWMHGGDLRPDMTRSIEAFEKALSVDPTNTQVMGNEASSAIMLDQIDIAYGQDPTAALDEARRSCERALAIKPTDHHALQNLGVVYTDQATWLIYNDRDPSAALDQSEEALHQAVAIKADFAYSWSSQCEAEAQRVRWMTRHGGDPAEATRRAREAHARALRIDKTDPANMSPQAHFELELARFERQARHDGARDAALANSISIGDQALAANPDYDDTRVYLAEAHLLRAQLLAEKKRPIAGELAAGIRVADQSLKTRADAARVLAVRAGLELLAARAGHDQGRAARAVELYAQALKSNPLLASETAADRAEAAKLAAQ